MLFFKCLFEKFIKRSSNRLTIWTKIISITIRVTEKDKQMFLLGQRKMTSCNSILLLIIKIEDFIRNCSQLYCHIKEGIFTGQTHRLIMSLNRNVKVSVMDMFVQCILSLLSTNWLCIESQEQDYDYKDAWSWSSWLERRKMSKSAM